MEPSHLPCSSLTHPAAILTPSIGVLRWIRVYDRRSTIAPLGIADMETSLFVDDQRREPACVPVVIYDIDSPARAGTAGQGQVIGILSVKSNVG